MTGKLERIPAYNTNTTSNEFCIRQHSLPKQTSDNICPECYSFRMLSTYRKNCVPAFERNSEAFAKPIRWDDLPVLNHAFVRINGHGELTVMLSRSKIRIVMWLSGRNALD